LQICSIGKYSVFVASIAMLKYNFLTNSFNLDIVHQELEALAGKHLNSFIVVGKLVQWIYLVWVALFSIVSLKASTHLVSTMSGT
jgi:hypothetical protein